MATLKYFPIIHSSSSSSSPLPHLHHSSAPKLFKITRLPDILKPLSLSSSLSSPLIPRSSTSPIFLPFLQENQNPQTQQSPEQEPPSKDGNFDSNINKDDPVLRFLKSQTSNPDPDPDPGTEGKISLQKNRKSSWHLAFETDNSLQDDEEIENFYLGSALTPDTENSAAKEGGVVGEILEKARTLPENYTLGEVLEGFEGRVSEKECWEVLGLMGEEGLIMGCLYFFEWMRLNEPSLVSPRSCTILFPVLGRAGMGDEIMVILRNLPNEKRFRDVHVYNAAMSGLLGCRRYCCYHYSIAVNSVSLFGLFILFVARIYDLNVFVGNAFPLF